MFCFDNASPEKSCFVDGLVCFISLCLRVFEFQRRERVFLSFPVYIILIYVWVCLNGVELRTKLSHLPAGDSYAEAL